MKPSIVGIVGVLFVWWMLAAMINMCTFGEAWAVWSVTLVCLPLGVALAIAGYVFVAGRVWRGYLPAYRATLAWTDQELVRAGIYCRVALWPLWLIVKYLALGATGAWRFGIRGCLRAVAWPFAAAWRAGAGELDKKGALPEARVINTKD